MGVDLDGLFDGELHELIPGEDFVQIRQRFYRKMTTAELRAATVERGWASMAVRLNAIAQALGGKRHCAWQKGHRYFFKFEKEEQ